MRSRFHDAGGARTAKRRRGTRRPSCGATITAPEQLEARIALSVSAFEQEFIYLLNRARHNPGAYQVERGLSVNLGTITPRPPLAVNTSLTAAAEFKSAEMATRNYFAHTSVTGETPNQLVRRFGYALPETVHVDGQNWILPTVGNQIESIAAGYATPAAALKGLIESKGHREHLLGVTAHNQVAREVGIGYDVRDQSTYKHYWTVLIAPSKAPTPFLTGVAFVDRNGNRRFEAHEGLGSVVITASGAGGRFTTTTMAAGGWTLAVPPGDYVVTATGGAFSGSSAASVRVGAHNVAVDFISGTPTAWVNFAPGSPPPPPPVTAPGAPANVVATGGNAQAVLRWAAPSSNGGAAITNYVIQVSANNGSSWTTVNRAASTATTATVTGLVNGASYVFRVAAVNRAGKSVDSSNSNSVRPATVPGVPAKLVATAGNGEAVLRWTAPSVNGGALITNYVIQMTANNGRSWTTVNRPASTATTATVTGLANGTTYIFRVAAVNAAGAGGLSSSSNAVRPVTVPGAPVNVVATGGNAQAILRWAAPSSTGGAAITNYVIQVSANNGSSWTTVSRPASTATTATVTRLVNGVDYVFRVAAVNGAGRSGYSATSRSVRSATVPGGPTHVVATGGNAQAVLRWTAPSVTGGAAITNYVIQMSANGGRSWTTVNRAASAATTATVTGLANGTAYVFRVAAVNAAGPGRLWSNSNIVRPVTVPGAPRTMVATMSNAQAVLRWAAPSSTGGAAITNYVIQMSANNGSSWTTVNRAASTVTTATVTGLGNSATYVFRVAAVNAAGTGGFTTTAPDYPVTRANPGLAFEKMLDMANTSVARKIEDKLRSLAQGNERSAEVTKITVDRATGDVTGGFKVRHRQVSGKVYNPVSGKHVPVVTYDLTQSGNFTFNMFSMQISGSLDLGRGIKVNLADLKKLSEGDLTPLWTSALTARQQSNYEGRVADIRARHGAANVYVAPKSFVDWMGPETLVRWGAEAIVSKGATLSTIPTEVANKLRAETFGIRNWLTARVKDAATAEAIATKIAEALANRGNIEDPRFSIRWSKVDYWYESNLVPGIRSQRIEHGMYSIVLKI